MRQSMQNRTMLVWVICIALGLTVGVGLGLVLSRGIKPLLQSSRVFAGLEVAAKEEYIVLVGAAFAADHDLERAEARLERLEAPNVNHWIASLIDRAVTEGWDESEVRALMELAQGLGMTSPQVLAYLATLTPPPTSTPLPTLATAPTDRPTLTPVPPSPEPTPVPPNATAEPTPTVVASDTPLPLPSDTPIPLTAKPSDTPKPRPTNTPKPKPTNTPAIKWSWSARLVGPGQEAQTCSDGLKLIRVTVLDAAGNQIPGVWVHEQYTNQYQVSGHKGDDPYWGPGEVELGGLDGGRVCIATGQGGACESDLTRNLPCHDPPPFEDLWAAGYCECCEPGISQERCRELFESGRCLGISHYAWRLEFRRSW
jgi:hypothetical protein